MSYRQRVCKGLRMSKNLKNCTTMCNLNYTPLYLNDILNVNYFAKTKISLLNPPFKKIAAEKALKCLANKPKQQGKNSTTAITESQIAEKKNMFEFWACLPVAIIDLFHSIEALVIKDVTECYKSIDKPYSQKQTQLCFDWDFKRKAAAFVIRTLHKEDIKKLVHVCVKSWEKHLWDRVLGDLRFKETNRSILTEFLETLVHFYENKVMRNAGSNSSVNSGHFSIEELLFDQTKFTCESKLSINWQYPSNSTGNDIRFIIFEFHALIPEDLYRGPDRSLFEKIYDHVKYDIERCHNRNKEKQSEKMIFKCCYFGIDEKLCSNSKYRNALVIRATSRHDIRQLAEAFAKCLHYIRFKVENIFIPDYLLDFNQRMINWLYQNRVYREHNSNYRALPNGPTYEGHKFLPDFGMTSTQGTNQFTSDEFVFNWPKRQFKLPTRGEMATTLMRHHVEVESTKSSSARSRHESAVSHSLTSVDEFRQKFGAETTEERLRNGPSTFNEGPLCMDMSLNASSNNSSTGLSPCSKLTKSPRKSIRDRLGYVAKIHTENPRESMLKVVENLPQNSSKSPSNSSTEAPTKKADSVAEIKDFDFTEDKDVMIDDFAMLSEKFKDYDFKKTGGAHVDGSFVYCKWVLPPSSNYSQNTYEVKVALPEEYEVAKNQKRFDDMRQIREKCMIETQNRAARSALDYLKQFESAKIFSPILIDSDASDSDEVIHVEQEKPDEKPKENDGRITAVENAQPVAKQGRKLSESDTETKKYQDMLDQAIEKKKEIELRAEARQSVARGPTDLDLRTLQSKNLQPVKITIDNEKATSPKKIVREIKQKVDLEKQIFNLNARRVIPDGDRNDDRNDKNDTAGDKRKIVADVKKVEDKRNIVKVLVPSRNQRKNWKPSDYGEAEDVTPAHCALSDENQQSIRSKIKKNKIRKLEPEAEFDFQTIDGRQISTCRLPDGRLFDVSGGKDAKRHELEEKMCVTTLGYLNHFSNESAHFQYFEKASRKLNDVRDLRDKFKRNELTVQELQNTLLLDKKKEADIKKRLDDFVVYCDRQHTIHRNGWETRVTIPALKKTARGQAYHVVIAQRIAMLKLFGWTNWGKGTIKMKGMGKVE